MESEACSGRPSTSRNEEMIEKVCPIVIKDCRLTLREIVEEVGISRELVQYILTEDLCMRRVSAKFIPTLLTEHDNATAQSTHVIKSFLAKNNTVLVRQSPYSPDFAPCDFWLFPKLKNYVKRDEISVT